MGLASSSPASSWQLGCGPCNSSTNCARMPLPSIEANKFKGSPRVLIFTDMSTECDDECALLWLVQAINKRELMTIVDLVMTDSHVRYQWMSYIFEDKLTEQNSEWKVEGGGTILKVGYVLINLYIAESSQREGMVINDIKKKAPDCDLNLSNVERDGKTHQTAIRETGKLGGNDYSNVPGGPCESIVVAGAILDVDPAFMDRFEEVKCTYVVGTPGGINCPMPSWVNLLASFHRLAPVLYLTPQFTRGVRFPTRYVLENTYWNALVKHTIFDTTLTNMARRPELPPVVGTWGLNLRLNFANAGFCQHWYKDVIGADVSSADPPENIKESVKSYVARMSGDDRKPGAVIVELKAMGIETDPEKYVADCKSKGITPDPEASNMDLKDIDEKGQPTTDAGKEALRALFKKHLYKEVMTCVVTTETLIFQNAANMILVEGKKGFRSLTPRSGYKKPLQSLAELYGDEAAVEILQSLPLDRLTPAYDVVAMMCIVSSLDGKSVQHLGLAVETADKTMGLEMLSEEQQALSSHAILMSSSQTDEVLEENTKRLSTLN
ncbi:unnamed protein product [Polarella glacialis]|uniref:Uncharacterized protein n=1 Tax=Polarella glacialis TaxID=89957 RepID=A0A813KX29_POLGL|nr:unnamed protein product [Polarella glacialis]